MEHSAADLCSRCASVPWDHLEQEERSWFWDDERPTLGDLQTSSCRLCRLITFAIMRAHSQYAVLSQPVSILWTQDPKIGNHCLGSIGLNVGKLNVAKLVLTTEESIREDMVASCYRDAPKRVDMAKVKSSLEASKASRDSYEPEASTQLLNIRVIDCIEKAVVMAPKHCSFVALSYVWGRAPANSYSLGSPLAFPPTIEDAVECTRKLGYQYLWVDRYCINQQDPCDKKEQISQMGQIYATAQLTIVAAAGVDPSYGLVGISRDRKGSLAREPVGSSRLLYLFPQPAQVHIVKSSWFSRAWTLQEGYLSKRILCFTEREAVFTCRSCSWMAEFSSTAHRTWPTYEEHSAKESVETAFRPRIKRLNLYDANHIMLIYSGRVRGRKSDTLNAVIGILTILRSGTPPIYHIWGVPFTITRRLDATHSMDSTTCISLNWYHSRSARRLPEFPSWSTLGWIGQVQLSSLPKATPHFMIKYWSGESYQELDEGACDLNYTSFRDNTHQSQYLEITTDVIQIELHSWCCDDNTRYFFQPTFVRQKEGGDRLEDRQNRDVQSPLLKLDLDDDTAFDATLPIVCATLTPPETDSDSWSSFRHQSFLLLVFQQKAKSYERIGASPLEVCTINMEGEYIHSYSDQDEWEFVPPGEPGAWDQVAERRTFLLG